MLLWIITVTISNKQEKTFEAKKGYNMKKNLGSLIHQAKCLQSIVSFNVLRAGYVSKKAMRLRLSSTSSNSPKSSPRKGFQFKKTHANRLIFDSFNE